MYKAIKLQTKSSLSFKAKFQGQAEQLLSTVCLPSLLFIAQAFFLLELWHEQQQKHKFTDISYKVANKLSDSHIYLFQWNPRASNMAYWLFNCRTVKSQYYVSLWSKTRLDCVSQVKGVLHETRKKKVTGGIGFRRLHKLWLYWHRGLRKKVNQYFGNSVNPRNSRR